MLIHIPISVLNGGILYPMGGRDPVFCSKCTHEMSQLADDIWICVYPRDFSILPAPLLKEILSVATALPFEERDDDNDDTPITTSIIYGDELMTYADLGDPARQKEGSEWWEAYMKQCKDKLDDETT